ncbi:Tim17/Tim22/Tim23/Pmp24 family-domain-containing protein [Xylaria arbuscula]|nr:Tim17/Tim22/Tim23/Pmp24 family-domain-containing protein [Xylaria arbuscula]
MNNIPGLGTPAPSGRTYDPNDPNIKAMNAMMESCFGKSAISGVMGFGMGGLFGMFMASMAYDTPFHTPGGPGSPVKPIAELPMREQLKVGFRDMGARSYSTAKNFGKVGLMFSGIECGIEGLRAKNDLANGVAAGCLTGGILAKSGGPTAVAGGCAAFAAFSAAIDVWLRQPKDE